MDNITNKPEVVKEKVSFFNQPFTRTVIFILIVGAIYFGYSHFSSRSDCSDIVTFSPAVEPVQHENAFLAKQGSDEYYSYSGTFKKFKTQEEAVGHCVRSL